MYMRRLIVFVLVLISFGGAQLVAHEDEKHIEEVKGDFTAQQQDIVAVLEKYAKAMESGDIEAVQNVTTANDDFSHLEGTFLDIGWKSYRDHLGPEISIFRDPQYRISAVRPVVSDEFAYATYRYALDVTIVSDQFEGGEHPVSMKGMATAIFVKDPEGWKIQHMHTVQENPKKAGASDH